ncbi:MAG: FprA family A-type flavoprotein [Ruminiclostridium sp.]
MYISQDIKYVGVTDNKIDLFESQYKVPDGISYNSYVITDEKTAVMDTADKNFTEEWLGNIKNTLGEKSPDYLIVQHMEPDHSASIAEFMKQYPDTTVVGNAKTFAMIKGFFPELTIANTLTVKEGDTLTLGRHTLSFVFAPMVHWPEVMVTYDSADKVLFSADGFGRFGAPDSDKDWAEEARRYYIGIVGKYGTQVQNLLKKASALDIAVICPLHGPVLSENLGYYLDLYNKWSSYTPETDGIMIAYTSVYGNTRKAAELLRDKLAEKGAEVLLTDLARNDMSKAVSDAFKYSKLVLATTTYNADIFPFMRIFIEGITERNYQGRTVAFIENGSWAPMAAKVMTGMFEKSKNLTVLDESVKITSALNADSMAQLDALAEALLK